MEKIAFADGEKICAVTDAGTAVFSSEAIERYREYVGTRKRNDEWKVSGEGARFRGDGENVAERVDAYINGVAWQDGKIVYAYTVNGSSGVCRRPLDPMAREEHIYSSSDREIMSVDVLEGSIAVTVRGDDVTSQVGVLDGRSSELVLFTEGDARDANAVFDRARPSVLLFDSAGAGRTADGRFTGKYAPAVLMELDRDTLALTERKGDGKHAYVKPRCAKDGTLYCIKRPEKESSGSLFLDIVLFPFRLLKALFGLLQAFTVIFGNTSLSSDMGTGDNPTKGRKQDARKLFVDGRYIDAAKEEKRNKKFKDRAYGFIPASWKLVKLGEEEEILAGGVCDFCIGEEGIYYTDGRHIFRLADGKSVKIADAERCLSLCVEQEELF